MRSVQERGDDGETGERERERNVVSELILLNENTGKLLMELGKW